MNPELNQQIEEIAEKVIANNLYIQGWLPSIIALIGLLIARIIVLKIIRKDAEILSGEQRKWINRTNNSTTLLLLGSLVFIWAPQLQSFALSLTAVAVAIVLITKELLMCLSGGFFRATTNAFNIGDWISVGGIHGEVMSISALSTTVEEIENKDFPYQLTGHKVQIPNSKYLTENIELISFNKHFAYVDFSIVTPPQDTSIDVLLSELKALTERHYQPMRRDALAFIKRVEKISTLDFADPEPQYLMKTSDAGNYVFSLKLFLKTSSAHQIRSDITQEFLQYIQGFKQSAQTQDKP